MQKGERRNTSCFCSWTGIHLKVRCENSQVALRSVGVGQSKGHTALLQSLVGPLLGVHFG